MSTVVLPETEITDTEVVLYFRCERQSKLLSFSLWVSAKAVSFCIFAEHNAS